MNPRRSEILGVPCYPAVGAIPEAVELAVIVTPAATVPGVVADCESLAGFWLLQPYSLELGRPGLRPFEPIESFPPQQRHTCLWSPRIRCNLFPIKRLRTLAVTPGCTLQRNSKTSPLPHSLAFAHAHHARNSLPFKRLLYSSR